MVEFLFLLVSTSFTKKILNLSFYSLGVVFLLVFTFEEFHISEMFFCDQLANWMLLLTMWLMMSVVIFLNSKVKVLLMNFIVLICLVFFLSKNILWMFITFELSIFPILVLVLGWGMQPERLQAGLYMFMYTLFCSSPLLVMISHTMSNGEGSSMWSSNFLESPLPIFSGNFYFLFFMLGFLTKIPIFISHVWLPKAHVEATLEGSMILAGVLLKLGVFGVIRVMWFFPFKSNFFVFFLMSVAILGSLFSALLALSSDDMKMTVAYASVSHMNILIFSLFTFKILGKEGSTITAFSHGMSSSLLFFSLYTVYNISHSRSMLLNKGVSGIFPILVLVFFISWALNLSVPPSYGFWGELLSILAPIALMPEMMIVLCLYFMFSSFYSMFTFGVVSHSETSFCVKKNATFLKDILGCFFLSVPLFFFFFNFS